jgi:hypothetical protein
MRFATPGREPKPSPKVARAVPLSRPYRDHALRVPNATQHTFDPTHLTDRGTGPALTPYRSVRQVLHSECVCIPKASQT